MTEQKDQLILKTIIRTPRDSSHFLYFTLESNEGIAFYTTMKHVEGDLFRDVECLTPIELKDEFMTILSSLKSEIELKILEQTTIKDSL